MATGWEALGNVLGGGIDTAGAYDEGRLHTARTEAALANARQAQLQNMTTEAQAQEAAHLDEYYAKMGIPNPKEMAGITRSGLAQDFSQATTGLGNVQDQGYQRTIGDPNASLADQLAAEQALQGKVRSPYEFSGQNVVDLRAPAAPGEAPPIFTTPAGEAQMDADTALTNLRNVQAGDPDYRQASGGGGAAGARRGGIPVGYKENPSFDPTMPESDSNPELVRMTGFQAAESGREAIFTDRIVGGATQAVGDLRNMIALPADASTGLLGIGSRPGKSIMQSTVDGLRNRVSADSVRAYNQQVDSLGKNLGFIENQGLAPSQGFVAAYDAMVMREGDTDFDRLRKLANVRQTIELGLQPKLVNPRVSDIQKEYMRKLIEQARQIIPFTVDDVNTLAFGDKRRTIADVIQQRKLTAPVTPPTLTTGTPGDIPLRNQKGWELMEDASGNKAYVSPSGEIEEVQ